jgi:hypothetical protein
LNDPRVVDEFANICRPVKVFVSERSVDDAAVPDDVSIYTRPVEVVLSVPAVVVESVKNPAVKFVVDAVVKDAYVVDEYANESGVDVAPPGNG